MSIDTLYADSLMDGIKRWAAAPGPAPEASFSLTSFFGAGGKSVPSGTLEAAGTALDAMSGFGTPLAASGVSAGGMFATPSEAEQKEEAAARARMLKGDTFDTSQGNILRRKAEEFAPDPLTAHKADQVIHGVGRVATKAVGAVATMGPLAGPVALGLEEGNTTTQNLRMKGVDTGTAMQVGGVVGAVTGLTVGLPLGGKTWLETFGLVAAGGPGSYIVQEALSREILQSAGYRDEASLHNPFDPLGLTLSTLLPAGFGAFHMRGVGKRQEAVASGQVPLAALKPDELRGLKYDDARLDAYASATAEKYGVPPAILLAIKNVGEKSGPTAVSPKGAQGVMQFMPGTAKEMGLADRTDPIASIDAGARYLKKLFDAYGSWDAAIAHYNGGGTQAVIVRGGGRPTYNETAGYLDRVQQYVAKHTAESASKSPEVVDAARVKVLDATVARSLPDTPDAMAQVMRAGDIVAESGGRAAEAQIGAAIPRDGALSGLDREIEGRLARKLSSDFDAAVREYEQLPDSMGGKVLNTDVARELSPDYIADRTRSVAVHEPASWFVKQLYEQKLANLKKGDRVVFTSGGTGAGKTSAIENVPAIQRLQEEAALVYDTNMSTLSSAVKKVDQALKAGADVHILHVQRDPVDALVKGALPRAMRQEQEFGSGRTVPLSDHAGTHRGAADVIQQLAAKYADNPRVDIQVIDNTRGKGGATVADLGFIRSFDYNGIEGKLHEALRLEFEAGRISEAVYRATDSQGVGSQDGRGYGEGPEPGLVRQQDAGAESPDFGEVKPRPIAAADGGKPSSLDSQLATRLAEERPDMVVRLPGAEDNITVGKALEQIEAEKKADLQWAELVRVAAECSLMAG